MNAPAEKWQHTKPSEAGRHRAANTAAPQQERAPSTIDHDTLNSIVRYVKTQRASVVDEGERLDILLLQAKLRYEHHQLVAKTPKKRTVKAAGVSKRASSLLNRKHSLVAHVWKDYWCRAEVRVARPPANYSAKTTRIPRISYVASLVQRFVRERQAIHQRTVAKDVVDLLARYGLTRVDCDSASEMAAALQSARQYLRFLGHERGGKKGTIAYRLREENVCKRDEYLSAMKQINTAKQQRVVYMDKSYVHHNCARRDDRIFDPGDEQDIQVAVKHKGWQYCFIAAIVDVDHGVPEAAHTPAQQAFFIPETLDIFEGGKKQTKGYHGMLDSAYFEHWVSMLLAALDTRDIKNAVIVLGDAKYHKRLPSDTPMGRTRKVEMQTKCTEYGLSFDKDDLEGALWTKLKVYVRLLVSPVIVQMAEKRGHCVLFTPPHYSDLQPIETVWAIVKGQIGR